MFGVLKQVLLLLLVSVRTALHLPWLRFNRWLHAVCRALLRKSEVPRRRVRVLLVGDGLAEGVGDWVTVGHRGAIAHTHALRHPNVAFPPFVHACVL